MSWGVSPAAARIWDAPALDPALLKATFLLLMELNVVTAIALFFSTFSTPMLSAALTFGLYIVGHFTNDLRNFADLLGSGVMAGLMRLLSWALPNLAQFDVRADVVHGQHVAAGYIGLASLYAAVYVTMLLTISVLIFSRRDFK
jgi:ABC-type transport system involved in multi-copper enzyme maturation permease subunit